MEEKQRAQEPGGSRILPQPRAREASLVHTEDSLESLAGCEKPFARVVRGDFLQQTVR